jgi:hypothetical protein
VLRLREAFSCSAGNRTAVSRLRRKHTLQGSCRGREGGYIYNEISESTYRLDIFIQRAVSGTGRVEYHCVRVTDGELRVTAGRTQCTCQQNGSATQVTLHAVLSALDGGSGHFDVTSYNSVDRAVWLGKVTSQRHACRTGHKMAA